jgi:hypothetical protein
MEIADFAWLASANKSANKRDFSGAETLRQIGFSITTRFPTE